MGDARRRSGTAAALPVVLALVAGALAVAPAAAALDDGGTHDHPATAPAAGGDAGDRLTAQASEASPDVHEHPPGTFPNSIVEAAHVSAEADAPVAAAATTLPT